MTMKTLKEQIYAKDQEIESLREELKSYWSPLYRYKIMKKSSKHFISFLMDVSNIAFIIFVVFIAYYAMLKLLFIPTIMIIILNIIFLVALMRKNEED